MQIYRVEWYADAYPAVGRYCQEYFKCINAAASRMMDLQHGGFQPTIETVYVIED